MIEPKWSTARVRSALPDCSTVVQPNGVGIVLEQNNFASMARPLHILHKIFVSFAEKNSTKSSNKKTDRRCTNVLQSGSKVSATIQF